MSRKSVFNARRRPWWLAILLALVGYGIQYFNRAPYRSTHRQRTQRSERDSWHMPESPGEAELVVDRVERVLDGDTVRLRRAGTVRLVGVDCPEKGQAGGDEARAWVTAEIGGRSVVLQQCAKQAHDRYGRVLGFLYVNDVSGRRVLFNRELVRNGYARVYSLRPCSVDEIAWNADYEQARREHRGLFATLGEVPDAAAWRRARR